MQKVNYGQKSTIKRKVNKWRQQMRWRWRKQVTSARADFAGMTSKMMSAGNPIARGAREARRSTSPKFRAAREGTWTIRWSRFFSDDVDRRRTILMVSTATRSEMPWWNMRHVEFFAETLTGAWMVRCGCFWRRCVERLKIYVVICLMS